jgi:hydrogenase maturation protein HypF
MSDADAPLEGRRIHVTGIVQGVGFRPFVYGLARRFALQGWVRNTSSGVDIEVDGPPAALDAFTLALRDELPPLARIDRLDSTARSPNGFTDFLIHASQVEAGAFQPISPDMSICPDCLRELFSPNDRRYRYPFINCTNCGPRFTIIRDIPYDRPLTTMAGFPLCPDCAAEYHDPLDRRFHAQPVACPVCGPRIWLEGAGLPELSGEEALQATRDLLRRGRILAIKGLGGFHLACDAADPAAVDTLRQRKLRVDKPFAVMMPDLATVERHCHVSEDEAALLQSRARPIVILQRRVGSPLAAGLAPGQDNLGVMLPYTPLHYLLLEPGPGFPEALVMTSGNLSEEPIAYTNDGARERLAGLADAFLLHDRPIHTRCDDSVLRVVAPPGQTPQLMPIRRSRGYAPFPVRLPRAGAPLLATGAELKNTFCVTRDDYAFLSHHIGDLENYETLVAFEEGVAHLERLFRVRPEIVAYDLHPDYMATRYALERAAREGLAAVGVQHHHAHIAACLAEHAHPGDRPVIGVAFDGTGYGSDGAIWGGEFLIADYATAERAAHLRYTPLPGGDRAVREPWRMALAALTAAGLPWEESLPPVRYAHSLGENRLPALAHQLTTGLNAPPTSSLGRLFDAAAALMGVSQAVNYEAQAAVEMEALADPAETGAYPLTMTGDQIDPAPLLAALLADHRAGVARPQMAARFHNGIAGMVIDVCRRLRDETGLTEVALSGGVWQNRTLLQRVLVLAEQSGFVVYSHQVVPANDGGLALGQAVIAQAISAG